MLWTIDIGMLAGAFARGMVATPGERRKADERDSGVTRVGEHIGGIVLAVAMVVPFGLAMAEFECMRPTSFRRSCRRSSS